MKLTTLILVCTLTLCMAIEEPKYEVIKQIGKNMEIRKYYASKWVVTRVENSTAGNNFKTQMMMFNSLFNYISGANSDKKKIEMTAPVVLSYLSKDKTKVNKNSEVTAYMSFYIPSQLQSNVPKPTVPNVFINELPEFVVAVVRFSGYAFIDDYFKNLDLLVKALGSDAKNYDTSDIQLANYNSPYNLMI